MCYAAVVLCFCPKGIQAGTCTEDVNCNFHEILIVVFMNLSLIIYLLVSFVFFFNPMFCQSAFIQTDN